MGREKAREEDVVFSSSPFLTPLAYGAPCRVLYEDDWGRVRLKDEILEIIIGNEAAEFVRAKAWGAKLLGSQARCMRCGERSEIRSHFPVNVGRPIFGLLTL